MNDPMHTERDTFDQAMGRKLAMARREQGLSERDVAWALDLFVEDIENYEAGREPIPTHLLSELCRLLGKPLSYWIDETGDVPLPKLVASDSVPGNDNSSDSDT